MTGEEPQPRVIAVHDEASARARQLRHPTVIRQRRRVQVENDVDETRDAAGRHRLRRRQRSVTAPLKKHWHLEIVHKLDTVFDLISKQSA